MASNSYKKLDMVHANRSPLKFPASSSGCCKLARVLPCLFCLLLFLTALCFLQATHTSHLQELSWVAYSNLAEFIQDNVLQTLRDGDAGGHETRDMCTGRGRCRESWGCIYCGGLENGGRGLQVPSHTEAENSTILNKNGYSYNYSIKLRPAEAWYRTHQFSLEVLFHAKMKKYACLTTDMARADAFYVPYYAGQDAALSLRCDVLEVRDHRLNLFLGWLRRQETWQRTRGHKHFMVLGRQPVDLNRPIKTRMWGLPVTSQPELANLTFLWKGKVFSTFIHEIGVPYPTSFHPSSDSHLKVWQETIKGAKREWLVSFLGSARRKFRHESTLQFRQELQKQCEEKNDKCRFLDCTLQYTRWQIPCESEPEIVTLEFSNAVFCLQPEGDTPTRKSFFDSIIAGCIPVVFSNETAHLQYDAYLPSDPTMYSIFLNKDDIALGKDNFVQALANISTGRVKSMQENIREHILPRIIYSSPSSSISFHDAFDIALHQFFSSFTS
ncbi:hypothetical protein GOP47_0001349 [Adiantum capillus-veneris]|uniref:Exostosin GT47 domain-containing protein n=1 Tax=Adiantum capillus-veneris TaxID=13818 RepID=A0A9D4V9C3_ADICA|nr:hypothetical protein GOP47_0001349 [Adiantum capillus-veneris]